MKKFSKEYAEELAEKKFPNWKSEYDYGVGYYNFTEGYMKAIEETNAKELLEALKPFAELLKQFDGSIGTRPSDGVIHAWHHNKHGEQILTVEMLKNAVNAISKAQKD